MLTTAGHRIENPTHLARCMGNGIYYLNFVCDGTDTEYATMPGAKKGTTIASGHQTWYCGGEFDNNP